MKSHGFVEVGGMVLRLQPCTAVSGQACQVWGEESVECMFPRRLLVQVVQDVLISLMLLSSVECCEDGPHKRLEDEWEDLSNNTQAPSTGTRWQSLQRSMLASARSSLSLSPSSFFFLFFILLFFLMCDLLVFVVFLVLFFVVCPCRLCSALLSFHKRTWLSMQGWTAAPGIVIRPSMIKSNNFQLLFQEELFIKDSMKLWGCGQHLCWWHSPSSREWLHYRGTHQSPMVIIMCVLFSFLVGEPWTCLWW